MVSVPGGRGRGYGFAAEGGVWFRDGLWARVCARVWSLWFRVWGFRWGLGLEIRIYTVRGFGPGLWNRV